MITVTTANDSHKRYIPDILSAIYAASQAKGNSIVMRDPDYLAMKMDEGKAVIALDDNRFVGFCYIECWEGEQYVANSGLIVVPEYRGQGIATRIKKQILDVSRTLFPHAKIFGITKSKAVIKINKALGFKEVEYSQLTSDEKFWKGCETCPYYNILLERKHSCECQALMYTPED